MVFTCALDYLMHIIIIVLYPLNTVFTVTPEAVEYCDPVMLPLSFTLMCEVDPAAVISWQVTGVTPPLGSSIARGGTVRSFTYPAVIGQALLIVNDPSGMDVMNQTCFICRADYPSGVIARSDPTCVNVAGKWNAIMRSVCIYLIL